MSSQQVKIIYWENLDEYNYDNLKIEIPLLEKDLQENFYVNGRKLKDFIVKSKQIEIYGDKLLINLKNMFGEIRLSYKNIVKSSKIAPSKIFKDLSPKEAYLFIKNKVFSDIGNFLSLLVRDFKELKMLENLKIIKSDFVRSLDYIIIFLEKSLHSCENILSELFYSGPIHKEILAQKSITGSKIFLSPRNFIEPYKFYIKQTHTLDTILNKMLFQTLYFIIQECNYIKYAIRQIRDNNRKNEILSKINKIAEKAHSIIDMYQLWCFFSENPINISELSCKIMSQPNSKYKDVFEIYKEIVKITFSKTILINIEEGIEFPIRSFEHIYELWAISSLYNYFRKKYNFGNISFENYKKRKAKMIIEFFEKKRKERIFIIYEIKFIPSLDSLYFEKMVGSECEFNIKPDLLIILEKKKKIFLGDIKFSKNEKIELPRVRDLYKIIGYINDIAKKSQITKSMNVEGILIFPGFIQKTRIPTINKSNGNKEIIYINIIPLNFKNNSITL